MIYYSGILDYVEVVEVYVVVNNYFFELEEIFEIVIEVLEEEGLKFIFGEFFEYLNFNYLILGVFIEEFIGKIY